MTPYATLDKQGNLIVHRMPDFSTKEDNETFMKIMRQRQELYEKKYPLG